MSMTVVVTRNVEARVRGFLASTMLEIASGVYTSPDLDTGVRERIWEVFEKWGVGTRGDSVVMTWPDGSAAGGQVVRTLGELGCELYEASTLVLMRRELSQSDIRSLITLEILQGGDKVPF